MVVVVMMMTTINQRQLNKTGGSGQPPSIPYGGFLTCLATIAERLFPSLTQVEAMQTLLMDHILTNARKR